MVVEKVELTPNLELPIRNPRTLLSRGDPNSQHSGGAFSDRRYTRPRGLLSRQSVRYILVLVETQTEALGRLRWVSELPICQTGICPSIGALRNCGRLRRSCVLEGLALDQAWKT
jgi:hypothetical protein